MSIEDIRKKYYELEDYQNSDCVYIEEIRECNLEKIKKVKEDISKLKNIKNNKDVSKIIEEKKMNLGELENLNKNLSNFKNNNLKKDEINLLRNQIEEKRVNLMELFNDDSKKMKIVNDELKDLLVCSDIDDITNIVKKKEKILSKLDIKISSYKILINELKEISLGLNFIENMINDEMIKNNFFMD